MDRESGQGLKVRVTKAWLVEVVDENDKEVCSDWCFGTRNDALREGERMARQKEQEIISNANPAAMLFLAMNKMGGAT